MPHVVATDLPVLDHAEIVDSLIGSGESVVVLADVRAVEDIQRCDLALSVGEAKCGADQGAIGIIAEIASPEGLLALPGFSGRSSRLRGVAWNSLGFCRALGCEEGSAVAQHAYFQFVIGARAAGLPVSGA